MRFPTPYLVGVASILGGLLLLAYTQVSTVLPDPNRTELSELREGSLISEGAAVLFSALLVTFGTLLILAHLSPAPRFPRTIALGIIGVALPIFYILQTLLVINGISASHGAKKAVTFSASYFFHSGDDLSFAAVYILFFFNLLLVLLLLGAVGYLLAPTRFRRALFDPMSWAKNEAIHIAATVFLLLGIGVLFFYLLRLVAETDAADLRGQGLLAQNLVPVYYLLCFLLLCLFLTVAAHAFLLNWGTQTPLEFGQLVENIRTIARVERGLLGAAALLNVFILFAPQLPSNLPLTQSFVFGVSPRGLSYAFYLLLLPYLPYAVTQRRLDFLLRNGLGPPAGAVFAERSLRLVLVQVAGIALLTTAAVAANWQPLSLMLAYSAWTAGVLLAYAVRIETGKGLPRIAFHGDAGAPLYFVFVGLALTTGFMLWGAGNTFEAAYDSGIGHLEIVNDPSYGQDVLGRLTAAVVVAGTLLLSLDLWLRAYHVERRFLVHYLGIFLTTTIALLFVFTVGVWTSDAGALEDTYAGFAFRQFDTLENVGAGLLLAATVLYVAYAIGSILRAALEKERARSPAIKA